MHHGKSKLLIVDELGYRPLEPQAAHLFFQLVSRALRARQPAHHQQPSRRGVGRGFWGSGRRTAILDRLLHHSNILTIRGESYRLKEKRKSGLLRQSALPSIEGGVGGVDKPWTAVGARLGEKVRSHVISLGTAFHTFDLHGHRWLEPGTPASSTPPTSDLRR